MMEYLINNYGQIKREDLRTLKTELEDHIYDPILPIDVLFNKVDFFSDLTEFVEKPLSDTDKVDIVYIILNRCGVFQNSLLKWNQLPSASQTYDEMKKFFRQEHLDLEKVNALTKQETSLNHAAFMSQQEKLIEQMETRLKANLVEAIGNFAAAYEEDTASNENTDDKENTPPDLVSALSTITGNSNKQMEHMMKLSEGMCK